MFLLPPLLLHFSLLQRGVQERRKEEEGGRMGKGKTRRGLLLHTSIARGDPNVSIVSSRANTFLSDHVSLLLLLLPYLRIVFHRKREDDKEIGDKKERGRDRKPGKVTVTFSRYVTVNLLRLRVISVILDAESWSATNGINSQLRRAGIS